MIAGGLLLGTIGVFFVESGVDALTAVWFRCVFGAAALLAWAALAGRLGELKLTRAGALAALGSGVLVLANWALFFQAVAQTSIAVATVVFHVQPFWVMAIAAWRLGERVGPAQAAAAVVALGGLALATGLLDGAVDGVALDARYLLGIALCLAASLSYAVVTLIAKAASGVTPLGLAFWQCTIGSVLALAGPIGHGMPGLGSAWLWLAGLGVLHTGLAYALLYGGMALLPAGRIAVLQFVYPATAIVVDVLVYGRVLSPVQLAGIAMMAAALWSVRRR